MMGRASDPHEIESERRTKASERAATNLLTKLGMRLEKLDRWLEDPPDGETYIAKVTFKVDAHWDGGVLAMVHATIGGEKRIAFHGADTFAETLMGLVNRLDNGSLKWKVDTPYGERKDQA